MKTKRNTRERIGVIGVDAGLCWLGDPCYILHADPKPATIGQDWEEFCDILEADDGDRTYTQFDYNLGHPGLGVVVSTGYGDGVYPVYVEFNEDGRVAKVCVEFIEPDDSERRQP